MERIYTDDHKGHVKSYASIRKAIFYFNGLIRKIQLGDIQRPCKISPLAHFSGCRSHVDIGANTFVFARAHLQCDSPGGIKIGSGCEIHEYARLMTYGGSIIIGDHCSVNPYSILYGHGGLEIGSKVRIAAHVVIIPVNHGIDQVDLPIMDQEMINEKITIKDNVWIGAGAKILGGVMIGPGAVIGANAVVTHDVPENAIMVGVPAKILRIRDASVSRFDKDQ